MIVDEKQLALSDDELIKVLRNEQQVRDYRKKLNEADRKALNLMYELKGWIHQETFKKDETHPLRTIVWNNKDARQKLITISVIEDLAKKAREALYELIDMENERGNE